MASGSVKPKVGLHVKLNSCYGRFDIPSKYGKFDQKLVHGEKKTSQRKHLQIYTHIGIRNLCPYIKIRL